MLKNLSEIIKRAEKTSQKKRLVLCNASSEHSLEAVFEAYERNITIPILVGDKKQIQAIASKLQISLDNIEIYDVKDREEIIKTSVSLIREGKGDVLMKGDVTTSEIMKGVLNKDYGIRGSGMISHFALFELPFYHKLVVLTDAAMNISPNLEEKKLILENTINFCLKIGIEKPKVAVLAAVEHVSLKMPVTEDAFALKQMNLKGEFKDAIVEGPISIDLAMSKQSAAEKRFESQVAADADVLFAPDIEAGNMIYKIFGIFIQSKSAGVILGAKAPIVLTSRSDSEETKMASIALAIVGSN